MATNTSWQALWLGVALLGLPRTVAALAFAPSDLEGQGMEIIFCDLDGDRLQDIVLVEGLSVSIFFQEPKRGYSRKPQLEHRLDESPRGGIIWPARLGGAAESLLLLTSQGVTEFAFTNRSGPPARRLIVQQPTILPEALDEPRTMYLTLSARTGAGGPLVLVPVAGGLQVWRRDPEWRPVQLLAGAVDSHLWPSISNPGYTQGFGLSVSLADMNGDGGDDLMVMRYAGPSLQTYHLYRQQTNRLFTPEPVLTYTNQTDSRSTLYWIDLNRDDQVDLIKSTLSDEPSFIPGMPSGKALIGAYVADGQGRIPTEPQQVFRKHDWSSALPVVDLDGDGYLDLVMGNISLENREGMRRLITTEQAEFGLRCYCYRPGAGFPKEPDCQRPVLIHFGREFFSSFNRHLDFQQFINLQGDFNGDGKRDLAVRDRGHQIVVYYFLSRERGFSSSRDLKFDCPEPIDAWAVKDLNGDGICDVVVKLRSQNTYRVFLSKGR